ncbi:unnamed protein product [Enterobius vermicularis]|uniref:Death domain-containing protein n=1 Tax=Enterobius vermicularis TaxID=51028 RepID=A0A0N4VIN4_ENTVE|nr:unnamed protein product [Enterobius vermicularis]
MAIGVNVKHSCYRFGSLLNVVVLTLVELFCDLDEADFSFDLSGGNGIVADNGFCKNGAKLLLIHEHNLQERLMVLLNVDPAVEVCKQSDTATDNWIVPCNVVGLKDGDTGKKKQQKRPIRFLMHPETLRLASYDKNLSARIGETAKETISQLTGKEWHILSLPKGDGCSRITGVKELLINSDSQIHYLPDRVVVCFFFKTNTESKPYIPITTSQLSLQVNKIEETVANETKELRGQKIILWWKQKNTLENLLELQFVDSRFEKWLSIKNKDHKIHSDISGIYLDLCRANVDSIGVPVTFCEHMKGHTFDSNGSPFQLALNSPQAVADQHRKSLDLSISDFLEQEKITTFGRKKGSKNCTFQSFKVIRRDKEETLIQFTSSNAADSIKRKQDSGSARDTLKTRSNPLKVLVCNDEDNAESLPETILASSPADSVDSGVSCLGSLLSSPSSSPNLSPVHAPKEYRVHFSDIVAIRVVFLGAGRVQQEANAVRQRSKSENCGETILKGILKKTTPVVEHRGRFTRSLSECQNDISVGKKIEGDEGCGGSGDVYVQFFFIVVCFRRFDISLQKKHVSFSDRLVQKYSFRPNSSILGQRRKNQKKARSKLKKKLSEESSEECEKLSGNEMLQEIRKDIFSSNMKTEKPGGIRQRVLRTSIGEETVVVFESYSAEDDQCDFVE